MTKFKTLRDLNRCVDCTLRREQSKCVSPLEIKNEAIKRIKKCHDACSKGFRCKACERDMWFNNLTEEDLI